MEEPIESSLTPRHRLSIVLRNRLGFSYEVIAGFLQHPSASAAQRYHSRSLDMLRKRA
jgi:DNA-directed RNA polymerase specialized sigma24 family protein